MSKHTDDLMLSLLQGTAWPPDTTDVTVARLQGMEAALSAIARRLPGGLPEPGRPQVIVRVVYDDDELIPQRDARPEPADAIEEP